jgi:hypothetical protein
MAAVANNPTFAKKAGIKPSVGEEFMKADKGKTFSKGGRTRRFAGGGDADAMLADTYNEPVEEPKHEVAESPAPKAKSFSQAFREARAAGDKTFEWNGKKYGTELAKPAAKPTAKPVPSVPATEDGGYRAGVRASYGRTYASRMGETRTPGADRALAETYDMPLTSHTGSGRGLTSGDVPDLRRLGVGISGTGAGRSSGQGDYPATRSKSARYADQRPSKRDGFAQGGSIKMKEMMGPRSMREDVEGGSNTKKPFGQHGIQKRGMTRGMEPKMAKFAAGGHVGSASKRADGIASKGKTKGRMVMCKGGKM